jgi:hypothetical protein
MLPPEAQVHGRALPSHHQAFSPVTTRPCVRTTQWPQGPWGCKCTPPGQLSALAQFKMQLKSNENWHAASVTTRGHGTGALQNSTNGPAPVGYGPRQLPGGCGPARRARVRTPHRPRGGGGGTGHELVVAAGTPTAQGGPVCPGWLYTRGRPSLGHNSGQWVELVVVPWRVGRQVPNGFFDFFFELTAGF